MEFRDAAACDLPSQEWRTVTWREGTNTELSGRFARARMRVASGDAKRAERRREQWLLGRYRA